MKNSTKKLINVCSALLLMAALIAAAAIAGKAPEKGTNRNKKIDYELAKVLEIKQENCWVDEEGENYIKGSQQLGIEILTGEYKGRVITVYNHIGPTNEKLADEGNVLTVKIEPTDGAIGFHNVTILTYNFVPLLIIMLLLFVAAVAIVGRWKGIMSLVGLAATLVSVLFFLIPMWLKGYKAIPLTFAVCIFVSALSFVLIGGITRKTVSAMLGTALCLLVACAFAMICSGFAHLSGMNMAEADNLLVENRMLDNVKLNIRGLFVSGILISALGAVMDVAMSIASAVTELREVNPGMKPMSLFKSGMNIGRDMIGTMTNTLILAFVGTSLNTIIIMYIAGMKPYQLINNDAIMMEVIRGLAGSIGLILAVPLTAAVAAARFEKHPQPAQQNSGNASKGTRQTGKPQKRSTANDHAQIHGGMNGTETGESKILEKATHKGKKGMKKS